MSIGSAHNLAMKPCQLLASFLHNLILRWDGTDNLFSAIVLKSTASRQVTFFLSETREKPRWRFAWQCRRNNGTFSSGYHAEVLMQIMNWWSIQWHYTWQMYSFPSILIHIGNSAYYRGGLVTAIWNVCSRQFDSLFFMRCASVWVCRVG